VCANDGAINDRTDLIDLKLQLAEDRRPVALSSPVCEAVVHALPRAEPLGQIAPRQAGFRSKENGFHEEPIAARGLRAGTLPRQMRLQPNPLSVAQCMTMHADL
jgi:hypothetical protein